MAWALELQVGTRRYEVRAERGASPALGVYSLSECDTVCTPSVELEGSIGVTGNEVVVTVPLTALEVSTEQRITGLRAFSGPALGGSMSMDEIALPDADLVRPHVAFGLAADEPPPQAGWNGIQLSGGAFQATATASAAPKVWLRVCLGEQMCDVVAKALD